MWFSGTGRVIRTCILLPHPPVNCTGVDVEYIADVVRPGNSYSQFMGEGKESGTVYQAPTALFFFIYMLTG